jgi:hypothetical protein
MCLQWCVVDGVTDAGSYGIVGDARHRDPFARCAPSIHSTRIDADVMSTAATGSTTAESQKQAPQMATKEDIEKLKSLVKEVGFVMLCTNDHEGKLHSRPMAVTGELEQGPNGEHALWSVPLHMHVAGERSRGDRAATRSSRPHSFVPLSDPHSLGSSAMEILTRSRIDLHPLLHSCSASHVRLTPPCVRFLCAVSSWSGDGAE